MSTNPNNFSDSNNYIDNEKQNKMLTTKQQKLKKQIEDGEIQYQIMKSKRPTGGSGMLGGNDIINPKYQNNYKPLDYEIMKTMENLDIEWKEAEQFLITQKNIYLQDNHINLEQYNLRKIRMNYIKSNEKEKENKRELYKHNNELEENQLIEKKKEKSRIKGLVIKQKEKDNIDKQIQISKLNHNYTIAQRIQKFDIDNNSKNSNNDDKKFNEITTTNNDSKYEKFLNFYTNEYNNIFNKNKDNNNKIKNNSKNIIKDNDCNILNNADDDNGDNSIDADDDDGNINDDNNSLSFKDFTIKDQNNYNQIAHNTIHKHQSFLNSNEWKLLINLPDEIRIYTMNRMFEEMINYELHNRDLPNLNDIINESYIHFNDNINDNINIITTENIDNAKHNMINLSNNNDSSDSNDKSSSSLTKNDLRELRLRHFNGMNKNNS